MCVGVMQHPETLILTTEYILFLSLKTTYYVHVTTNHAKQAN